MTFRLRGNFQLFPVAPTFAGMSAGQLLRKQRIAAGLRQTDVAKRTGLRAETISRIEHGHSARRSTLRLVAVAVGLPAFAIDEQQEES